MGSGDPRGWSKAKSLSVFWILVALFSLGLSNEADARSKKKNKQYTQCEKLLVPSQPISIFNGKPVVPDPLVDRQEYRVMTYNLENFSYTKVKGSKVRAKPQWAIQKVAKAIRDIAPDFGVLTEIFDIESCLKLIAQELAGEYDCYLRPGNDERGINIALMVKKGLNVKVDVISHVDEMWTDPKTGQTQKLFSRDLPVWVVRNAANDEPLLVVAGTHGKSKRDRSGDKESFRLRSAQMARSVEILNELMRDMGDVPLIWGGDFNTDVRNGAELEVARAQLIDAFDVAHISVPKEERITHSYHPNGAPVSYSQLDGFFVNEVLKNRVTEAGIYIYKDSQGRPLPLPKTFKERQGQGSDHRPSYLDIMQKPA